MTFFSTFCKYYFALKQLKNREVWSLKRQKIVRMHKTCLVSQFLRLSLARFFCRDKHAFLQDKLYPIDPHIWEPLVGSTLRWSTRQLGHLPFLFTCNFVPNPFFKLKYKIYILYILKVEVKAVLYIFSVHYNTQWCAHIYA